MLKFITLITGVLISSTAFASGGYYGEGHHRHGHHHGHRYHPDYYGPVYYAPPPPPQYLREEVIYYPQPVIQRPVPVTYYPERVIYEQAPAPVYQPAPAYGVDRRNSSGLVGGALGSVLGYEAGRGDPLAAGIGAAAGSLLGNSMHR